MSQGRDVDMLKMAAMQARICKAASIGIEAVSDLAEEVGAKPYWYRLAYVQAAALVFRNHCHLSIVGSDDRHDWLQNLSAEIDDRDDHGMHAGFRSSAEMIYNHMVRCGLVSQIGSRELYLGGHSCGGAIAQALSSPVIAKQFDPCEVYVFGSPRVFSPRIAARMSSARFPTYRFNMPGDPVPHFPLTKFRYLYSGAAYAHGGIEFKLHDDGDWVTESPKSIASLITRWAAVVKIYGMKVLTPGRIMRVVQQKHSVSRYLDAINKAIAREV